LYICRGNLSKQNGDNTRTGRKRGGREEKKTGGRTHGTAVDLRCYGKKKKERAYETTEKTKAQERQRNVHAQAITQTLTKKKKKIHSHLEGQRAGTNNPSVVYEIKH
jgi:hypothetical protein